jgi:signal transduction histidine kinase
VEQFIGDPDVEHKFEYSCDPRPLVIAFDHTLMRKAVNNLVTNAIKYSPKGSTVFVSIARINESIQIRVRDEGVGIPEADQPRLFEAFHRGSNVGTISGTGLGLTITKQSIEAHGGSLSFESKLNVGTTFLATIPIQEDIKETT